MKEKITGISLFLIFYFISSLAGILPDTTWKKGGIVSFNFSQSSFSNWVAGGQNAVSGITLLSVFADYKVNKTSWDSNLDMAYGLIQQGKEALQKSDDRIELNSKYGYAAGKQWHYTGLMNIKSQLAPGYSYPNDSVVTSGFFSPAYLLLSAGMDYKPSKLLSVFISPVTEKATFVMRRMLADKGAFGVAPAGYDSSGNMITQGERIRIELGGYLRAQFRKDIMKNVSFVSKLELFSNYFHNPQNIDINWEMLISMKINKFIAATLSAQLIYDDDIDFEADSNSDGIMDVSGPRTQFREVLGIGFSYKF